MNLERIFIATAVFFFFLIPTSCNNRSNSDNRGISQWGQCTDYTRLEESAQCRSFSVPLDYDKPAGTSIDISAFRYLGTDKISKGQIWFLQGGPGGSGRRLSRLMVQVAKYYPDFDFYSLDHRGVGLSTRFGCSDDNDIGDDWEKYQDCYNKIFNTWGEKLKEFSTTNAARDLHEAINRSRQEGKKVFIWGTSYGTYWLLRYLQLYPNEVDGIILDSICTPGECYLDRYDRWNDMVGAQFLELCQADPICNEKMSSIAEDPKKAVEEVFRRIDQGLLPNNCNNMFTREEFRHVLATLLSNWSTRVLIPPLIYRLSRCNEGDREVLDFFLQGLQVKGTDKSLLNSPMLCDLISLSELFGGSTSQELQAFLHEAHFAEDVSLRFADIYEAGLWNIYRDDIFSQKLPETDIPMLMVNGTTDPQTPLEIAGKIALHFTGQYQHFVAAPYATHGVLVNSPITPPNWIYDEKERKPQTCGSLLFGQFINDPKGPLDTSCTQMVYPVEFDPATTNNKMISNIVFGTEDMWD
ncbi:MAG: hypothetical protein BA861_11775 [Desulfobacterales bacterium S3730MH5]|nr:MAG: hypothetical protein BA861_11775 [Desulfobacterales bacterium S3730MH5]